MSGTRRRLTLAALVDWTAISGCIVANGPTVSYASRNQMESLSHHHRIREKKTKLIRNNKKWTMKNKRGKIVYGCGGRVAARDDIDGRVVRVALRVSSGRLSRVPSF